MSLLQHRIWTPRTCCKMFLTYANSRTSFVSWYLFQTIYNLHTHHTHSCCRVQWHCWQQATVMMSWLITCDTWQQRDHSRDKWDGVMCPALSARHTQINIVWPRDTWHVTLCPSLCTCLYVTTQTIRRPSVSTSQWILSAAPPATVVLVQYSMQGSGGTHNNVCIFFWFYPLTFQSKFGPS